MTQFLRTPIQPGKVYPTLYVTKEEFDSVAMPANCRRFVVIRDLRDTLVSLYFSHKFSHALLNEEFVEIRRALEERDEEEGLLFILEGKLVLSANIQRSCTTTSSFTAGVSIRRWPRWRTPTGSP